MNYENFFKDVFESIPNYRERVLLKLSIKNDEDSLKECGLLRSHITRLNEEFKYILMEQIEENFGHIKNQGETAKERFLDK